jgi:hypothetical protein
VVVELVYPSNAPGRTIMRQYEHLLGDSRFYDSVRDTRLRNSMEITIDLNSASWEIMGMGARDGETITIDDPRVVRVMQLVVAVMRRQARKHERVTMFPRPRATRPRYACNVCRDRTFLEDDVTGDVWPCPACDSI